MQVAGCILQVAGHLAGRREWRLYLAKRKKGSLFLNRISRMKPLIVLIVVFLLALLFTIVERDVDYFFFGKASPYGNVSVYFNWSF